MGRKRDLLGMGGAWRGPVIEFAFGAVFGSVLTLMALVVFVRLLASDDDDDDEWNPWGRDA